MHLQNAMCSTAACPAAATAADPAPAADADAAPFAAVLLLPHFCEGAAAAAPPGKAAAIKLAGMRYGKRLN